MKESEKIEKQILETDCEFTRLNLQNKLVGVQRVENFEFRWLEKIRNKFPVENSIPYRYTITTESHGVVDFYPKGNKVLIRKTNTWKKPGLKFIISKLLKQK